MTRKTSITLGDHFAEFVDQKIEEGRYHTASEVIRAGLRLLEEQELKLQALRAAIIEGEESGAPEVFDAYEFLAEMRATHAK